MITSIETAGNPTPEDLADLGRQIVTNCHRSDARHAGSFSLCGLLLRLRDYYRWEHHLPPWAPVEEAQVLVWIEAREALWEGLAEQEPAALIWGQARIDPFDSEVLNQELAPAGWYYGAGLAAFLKPTFFLGQVIRRETLGEYAVIHLGREVARDLFTTPALARERELVARAEPLTAFLWDSLTNLGGERGRLMDLALAAYGLDRQTLARPPKQWADRFQELVNGEIEAFIHHEYGEVTDPVAPRSSWLALFGGHPHGRVELMARTIKDLLADHGPQGRLEFIINKRRMASLAILLARLEGLPARMTPELRPAFGRLMQTADWSPLEVAREKIYHRVAGLAREMLTQAETRPEYPHSDSAAELSAWMEARLYRPLGL